MTCKFRNHLYRSIFIEITDSNPLLCVNYRWIYRKDSAPIFIGGPHVIWGLTGYIIDRFVKDVLARYSITLPSNPEKNDP